MYQPTSDQLRISDEPVRQLNVDTCVHAIGASAGVTSIPFAILVNRSAGSFRFFGLARLKAAMRRAGLGQEVPLVLCTGSELHDRALELVHRGVQTLGVLGGDGSARTVALALRGLDVPILPLPGGTLNRLCHRVHGHANLGRTLRGLSQAQPIWLSGGLANEHVFLVASGFGPWMAFHTMRETIRRHGFWAGLGALKTLRHDLFAGKLRLSANSQACDIVIAAPDRVDEAFGLGAKEIDFPETRLETGQARLSGLGKLLWLAMAVLFRRWRKLSFTETQISERMSVSCGGDEIIGLVDGEKLQFGDHLVLRALPRAALVLSTKRS
ncbi:diacylglycerol kinase family protein [Aquidulcibacter sp.]|uniref:diacylglycerol/lipid kinase family protein n=1 Tax=Aquidulcibacter sp. TaxID=2052990 RepID=UPI0025B9C654|nr:diacylglycerol kinase family protein [Aquidulcibacter sp.]MCA3696396.1 NAD(+)/NADH kinase [Aquidulcibacter sp.]